MRFLGRGAFALVAMLLMGGTAPAYDILATVFQFAPTASISGDPNPTLDGVIKIDSETGVASPFLPENLALGFGFLTDIAIGPHDGNIYISSLVGTVTRFAPNGSPLGLYAFFGTPEAPDGVNTLEFGPDGTLYVATSAGNVAEIDPLGLPQGNLATGLTAPSSLALAAGGDLYVATGDYGGPGQVLRILPGGATEVVIGAGPIGGSSNITYLAAPGDYNADDQTDTADYALWETAYGDSGPTGDGNGDGVVDAADYTVWRDNQGASAKLLVADLALDGSGNEIAVHDLVSGTTGTLATIPIPLPDPLPEGGVPTNVPSEVLVTPAGTLLVSTLGPTQRPNNHGAVLEFDTSGALLQTIVTDLPPLSGIAILPASGGTLSVPEPGSLALVALSLASLARVRH